MNKTDFMNGWDILTNAGLHFTKEPTPLMGQTWYNLLKDIDTDEWLEIIKYWIANYREFPTVAELLNVRETINNMDFDIYSEIKKADFGRNPVDPLLQKAVERCGGWYGLGRCSTKQYLFMVREIDNEYKKVLKENRFRQLKHDRKQLKGGFNCL